MKDQRRLLRFLFPRLQSRLFSLVLVAIGASLLVHTLVGVYGLTRLAGDIPNDGAFVHDAIVSILLRDFLLAFLLTAPIFGLLVAIAFMRVVGPFWRMQVFMQEALEGQHASPLQLRKEDEFQEFCALLNRATEPLRAAAPAGGEKQAA